MSSAFYSLTLGSSHNRSKSKKEAELINNIKRNRESHQHKHTKHSVDTSHTLPSELDFFGSHHASTSTTVDGGDHAVSTSKNKRRKLEHTSDSEPESSNDDSSSSEEEEVDLPSPPAQKISISAPTTRSLPSSFQSFLSLLSHPLPSLLIETTRDALARNLKRNGWRSMWGVQGAVAGAMLGLGLDENEDKNAVALNPDVMVVAPTGSGKTLSYLLPLILKLGQPARSLLSATTANKDTPETENGTGIRSIILLPTHELATQIHSEIFKLLLTTKSRTGPQKNKEESWRVLMLEKATEAAVIASATRDDDGKTLGVDILIATPERLHALVEEKKISLASTRYLVLDEADRLLSHEFLLQTRPILSACSNSSLQKAFLSATMDAGPESEARTWLRDGGVRVVVGVKDAATTTVDQQLTFCGSEQGKLLALRNLITSGSLPPPTLIFVQSIERANQLYRQLVMDGNVAEVGVVHSERSKSAREKTVNEFREGKVWMLVVTELMARGLDFKGVEVVVNYDFPQTVQSYIHRIGRTGRAGRKGTAITFFTLEDGPYLRTIANVMRTSGCEVPPWMLELPKPSKNLKKQRRQAPLKRKDVGGDAQSIGKRDVNKKRDMIQGSKNRKVKQPQGPGGLKKKGGPSTEIDLSE